MPGVCSDYPEMDPELRTWLTDRKLAKKTLKILEKEEITSVDVISLLKDDDLQELKMQHSMSVGQLIELRETHDALLLVLVRSDQL